MRQFITISLVFLYINSSTELHEFLRLPVLFEHFNEHRQKVEGLSFWDFLVTHYRTNVTHDDHDNQLPFKNPSHSFIAATLTICTQRLALAEKVEVKEILHSSLYTEKFIASPLSEIFQPPRLS